MQNYRALQWAQTLIEERGHTAIHHSVKPSFANLVLWKSIYEYEGRFYVDAIRVGLYKKSIVEGESIQKFDLKRDMPWLDKDSVQAQDIKRFHWFSDGYVALDESSPYRIADVRYSQLPHQINGMWGIELNPEAAKGAHAQRYSARRSVGGEQVKRNLDVLWSMILGEYKKDE